jgi:hypothetical protein
MGANLPFFFLGTQIPTKARPGIGAWINMEPVGEARARARSFFFHNDILDFLPHSNLYFIAVRINKPVDSEDTGSNSERLKSLIDN